MRQTLKERAINGLHDYIIRLTELDLDASEPLPEDQLAKIEWMTNLWYRKKLKDWAAAGRLTSDGTLRLLPDWKPKPYTYESVSRMFPDLGMWDVVHILILADGTLEGLDMDAKENVLAVIREATELHVAQLFGSVLTELRRGKPVEDTPPLPQKVKKGSWAKCDVCGKPKGKKTPCRHCAKAAAGQEREPVAA